MKENDNEPPVDKASLTAKPSACRGAGCWEASLAVDQNKFGEILPPAKELPPPVDTVNGAWSFVCDASRLRSLHPEAGSSPDPGIAKPGHTQFGGPWSWEGKREGLLVALHRV